MAKVPQGISINSDLQLAHQTLTVRIRKKRIILALLVLLLSLFIGAVLLIRSQILREYAKSYLISNLDRFTGGKTSIENIRIDLYPFEVYIRGLVIRGTEAAPERSFLSVSEIWARPDWGSLFGSFRMEYVRLAKPSLYVEVRPDGSTNIPRPKASIGAIDFFRLIVEKLKISDGAAELENRRIALQSELENLILDVRFDQTAGSYQAQVAYQNGKISVSNKELRHDLNLSLRLLRDLLRVDKLVLYSRNSKVEAEGTLKDFKAPHGVFHYQGELDLSDLRTFYPGIRRTQGKASLTGKLELVNGHWNIQGEITGKQLILNTANVQRVSSYYSFSPELLRFDKIKIFGFHGQTEGSFVVEFPFDARLYNADLRFRNIGLLDLSLIANLDRFKFAGLLNGNFKASWRDAWKQFYGTGHLRISEAPDEDRQHQIRERVLPVSGELNFNLTRWSSSFENSYLRFAGSRLQFAGTLSANRTSYLQMEFDSKDLTDLSFLWPDISGEASFIGTLEGSLDKPTVRGDFAGNRVAYKKFLVDQASGQLEADQREIHLSKTVVLTGNSRVLLEGRVFLDPGRYLPSGAVHLLVKVKDVSVEDFYGLLGKKYPASGTVSGDFSLTGIVPQVNLQGVAWVKQGRFLDQTFDSGRFEIDFVDPMLRIPELSIQVGPGHLSGSVQMDVREQWIQSHLTASNIPLDRIEAVRSTENRVTGTLRNLQLRMTGKARYPSLEGSLETINVKVNEELLGDFRARVESQDEVLHFAIDSLKPEVKLKVDGRIALNENYDLQAKLSFENFVLSPYVKKVLPVAPATLSSQADGQVLLSGPLRSPERINLSGNLTSIRMSFRENELHSSQPFEFEMRDQKLSIKRASFAGRGTILELHGTLDLSGQKRLDLEMNGDFDLALLNEFVTKLNAKGNGKLNAVIRGTLRDPRIRGIGDIADGQFSYKDFPNSISQVSARLFFDEDQIKISNLSGASGGGKVVVNGDVAFAEETIKLINLKIEASEVRFRYPEGMRNVVDASLVLRGSQRSQLLAGEVRIVSASFQKGYDPIAEFLTSREKNSRISLLGSQGLGDSLRLDLRIIGDRNIKLDTSLIKMTSRADLEVKGTVASPLITGSIEASGGELYFQGARYRITRGRIDFVNPIRFDPRVDLEAETDLRDYRVVLTISGTADKFRADLRSDPPLSTFDLFNLVSSGSAGTGRGGSSAVARPFATAGRQQDSTAGATSLLSEGLSLKVGSWSKRILGLDRFRIDPFLVGSERDPSARVTFGQQVTKDLSITYSTSVSSSEQQVILLEYDLNDTTSVIASRDAEGSFGLDIRFRKRLRQKGR